MQIITVISSVVALATIVAAGPVAPQSSTPHRVWQLRMYTKADYKDKVVDESGNRSTKGCQRLSYSRGNDRVTSIHWDYSRNCDLILYSDSNCRTKLVKKAAQDFNTSKLNDDRNNKISSWEVEC